MSDILLQISKQSEAALTQIQQSRLPPTPEIYAVFFTHEAGQIPELSEALEKARLQSGGISAVTCEALYHKYVGSQRQQEILTHAAETIDTELRQMVATLGDMKGGASRYSDKLSNFSNSLGGDVSVEQLRALVGHLTHETREVLEQNQKLQQQLNGSFSQIADLKQNLDKAKQESLLDALTGVGNRKAFNADILRQMSEASERNEPLCLLMLDIDFFKRFNDRHGHLVGDQVLKLVARSLLENLKGRDMVARYGGEEFAILLPQTRLVDAAKVADALRRIVGNKKIIRRPSNEDLGGITLSVGLTAYISGEKAEDLIARADAALYRAKQQGRDRVVLQELP